MSVITRKVRLVWMIKDANNYQFDKAGNCYNIQRGNQLKRTLVGYTEGYCINSKFQSIGQIRKRLVKIEPIKTPF